MMQIKGYAVVCDNDCLADADGAMPESLKSEAEWAYFQAGLDAADIIVLGRKSHEVTPNPKARLRLVLTSSVEQPVWDDPLTVFWNPAHAPLSLAVAMFDEPVSSLAITGGTLVFDYFLTSIGGFNEFHLSRMQDVYLKEGKKLFSMLEETNETPESYLRKLGYVPAAWQRLDDQASVVCWRREG